MNISESDDDLHNPDPKRDRKTDCGGIILTRRGIANLGCLAILALGLLMLLYVANFYNAFDLRFETILPLVLVRFYHERRLLGLNQHITTKATL